MTLHIHAFCFKVDVEIKWRYGGQAHHVGIGEKSNISKNNGIWACLARKRNFAAAVDEKVAAGAKAARGMQISSHLFRLSNNKRTSGVVIGMRSKAYHRDQYIRHCVFSRAIVERHANKPCRVQRMNAARYGKVELEWPSNPFSTL